MITNYGMSYVTLAEAKAHLRLNGTSEDTQVQMYIDGSEDAFVTLTGRTLDIDPDTGFPEGVPASAKLAILWLTAHYFRVRGAFTDLDVAAMPFGFVSVCRRYSTKFVSPGAL